MENTVSLINENSLKGLRNLHIHRDEEAGFASIVAIHNDKPSSPGIGGSRLCEYPSFQHAVNDAIRLAQTMSIKTRVAEVPFTGAKGVIIKTKNFSSTKAFPAYGDFVNHLSGKFITGCDFGVTQEDMSLCRKATKHITGLPSEHGDMLTKCTALGITFAMEAAVSHHLKRDSLKGLKVFVQGVGKVGYSLVEELAKRDAQIAIFDTNQERVNTCVTQFGAQALKADEIDGTDYDIFSPCALGDVVSLGFVEKTPAKIICGGANNQIEAQNQKAIYMEMLKRDILYVPDFLANVGGTVYAAKSYLGETQGLEKHLERVVIDRTINMADLSKKDKINTDEALLNIIN